MLELTGDSFSDLQSVDINSLKRLKSIPENSKLLNDDAFIAVRIDYMLLQILIYVGM